MLSRYSKRQKQNQRHTPNKTTKQTKHYQWKTKTNTEQNNHSYFLWAIGIVSGVVLWGNANADEEEVDLDVYHEKIGWLEETTALFERYVDGKSAMGVVEFERYILEKEEMISESLIIQMFDIASRDGESVNLEKFLEFELLMSNPDADYRMLYRKLSAQGNKISRKDYIDFFSDKIDSKNLLEFFLSVTIRGEKMIGYNEFTQALKIFQEVKLPDCFNAMAGDQSTISSEQAKTLLYVFNHRFYGQIPREIFDNIPDILGEEIDFFQISAFFNITKDLELVRRTIIDVAENANAYNIDSKQFLRYARRMKRKEFTPLEVDIVFKMFDSEGKGKLSIKDYERIMVDEIKPSKSLFGYLKESFSHFGMGSIAGAVGAAAVYPIDLVKTRMQNQRILAGNKRLYNNSIHCFVTVIKNEGARGLYKGLGPQLVGVAPEKAIKLTMNDLLRDLFGQKTGKPFLPLEMLAGAGAGASQVLFTNPLEIVKIRLQVQGEQGPMGKKIGAITIVRELGITGLYKGASACLLRDIPFSAIYFPAYANLKILLEERGWNETLRLFTAGALAGVPAAFLVTPADVIKTRLQVVARTGDQTYKNIPDAVTKILREEGFSAFFKGSIARVCRSSPQFAFTLLAYEVLQKLVSPPQAIRTSVYRPPTNAPVYRENTNIGKSLRRESERWSAFDEEWKVNEEEVHKMGNQKKID